MLVKPGGTFNENGDCVLGAAVKRVNARLSKLERVRRFAVADAPFTVDNAQMTPTLKIRRHKIKAVYGERLEALYG